MNAAQVRSIVEAACAAVISTYPALTLTPDDVTRVSADGSGNTLRVEVAWLNGKGEWTLRMECPR